MFSSTSDGVSVSELTGITKLLSQLTLSRQQQAYAHACMYCRPISLLHLSLCSVGLCPLLNMYGVQCSHKHNNQTLLAYVLTSLLHTWQTYSTTTKPTLHYSMRTISSKYKSSSLVASLTTTCIQMINEIQNEYLQRNNYYWLTQKYKAKLFWRENRKKETFFHQFY